MKNAMMISGWAVALALAAVVGFTFIRPAVSDPREYMITVMDGETTSVFRAPGDSINVADGSVAVISVTGTRQSFPISGKIVNIR